MTDLRTYRPAGIFDVRDNFRETQKADGTAAGVRGPIRFAVRAVVTAQGRTEPSGWVLHTRRTLSGLSVFTDEVVDERPPRVARRLAAAVTSVELRVSSPGFQPADLAFAPTGGQRIQIDLAPGLRYPFGPATLLRGTVERESGTGQRENGTGQRENGTGQRENGGTEAGVLVTAPGARYDYRTAADGSWVLVLPDPPGPVDVALTLTLPRPAAVLSAGWARNGPVVTRTVRVLPGTTTSVPELRLRLI
ncbi:hypothetical protein AB0F72_17165 [Actinoplanes sp. NPDC023936]|uniref:hypothetical protein n=1 Tax=Actinoplanes sp. NPDC023936 TaxID=3154910 RepID=UPI0033CA0472